jgi:hypothetical protein
MDSVALATPPSESDTSTILDISGKLELTKGINLSDYSTDAYKEIVCIGVLEFIPGKDRGAFMDECYRILTKDGKMTVMVPYWNSWRSYYDPRFEWPQFCEQSFLCYNKSWREVNMKDLELECDFDFTYGYAWDTETQSRNDESRAFWTKRYANSVDSLQLTMTKRIKN